MWELKNLLGDIKMLNSSEINNKIKTLPEECNTMAKNIPLAVTLWQGNCLIESNKIKDGSVDMILCDLHLTFLTIIGILFIEVLLWIMN